MEIPFKEVFATLILTHDAVKEREATVVFDNLPFSPTPPTNYDKGVVSFALAPTNVLNYPVLENGNINMDLEVGGGELTDSIEMETSAGRVECKLSMRGADGNWSGWWQCTNPNGPQPLFAFTAIPFRVEHEKVADR